MGEVSAHTQNFPRVLQSCRSPGKILMGTILKMKWIDLHSAYIEGAVRLN